MVLEVMSHHSSPPLFLEIAATMGAAGVSVAANQASFLATHPWAQDCFGLLGAVAALFSIIASFVAIVSRFRK